MSRSSRPIVSYVLPVTSGFACALIPRIVPFRGTHTGRVAYQRKCQYISGFSGCHRISHYHTETPRTAMVWKSAILCYPRTLMSANSTLSVYCVTSVTSGFHSVRKIICTLCKSGCNTARFVRSARVNRLHPQTNWSLPQAPGTSFRPFRYLHLGLSMGRPHTDDAPSRSDDPNEFNALHVGGSQHISQTSIDPSPAIPKSGGIPGSPSSSFKDLTPTNFPPAPESRRRNAEQRAATLRADALIGEVEPNRVFCTLCKKWVQLRQDSSYCAYPWLQHRGKCLARQWVVSLLIPVPVCLSHEWTSFSRLFAVHSLTVWPCGLFSWV